MTKSALDELAEMQSNYLAELKNKSKIAYLEAIAKFFEMHPEVQQVKWAQYTPYFMDGDPCVFHLSWTEVDGVNRWDIDKSDPKWPIAESFERMMYKCEDALEFAFGDHVQVTVSRCGKVEIESYEHE